MIYENKVSVVAGTGHRPDNLPCGWDDKHPWARRIRDELGYYLYTSGTEKVISGLAPGWDIWLAETALSMEIGVEAHIPFPEQSSRWKGRLFTRYMAILTHPFTDIVIYGEKFGMEYYRIRDRAMVDDCEVLLALYNPEVESGGTYQTYRYCRETYPEKTIINFWKK